MQGLAAFFDAAVSGASPAGVSEPSTAVAKSVRKCMVDRDFTKIRNAQGLHIPLVCVF